MKKEIIEDKKNEINDNEIEETPENDQLFSDWSNIDATSIYRVGTESKKTADKEGLNQSIKETKSFLKIVISMIAVVFIIIIISSYYLN